MIVLRILEIFASVLAAVYLVVGLVRLVRPRRVGRWLPVVLVVAAPSVAQATVINATSCAKADVETAVASAVDGDTVAIPACASTTWTSAVVTSKGITIQGAGIASTTINNNGFDMTAVDGKAWRITGLTLTGTACVNALTESKAWRVDHVHFSAVSPGAGRCQNRLIWIEPTGPDYTKGLVDHNTFSNPGGIQIHVRPTGDGGNGEWLRALGLGTDDAVYVEDNTFTSTVYNSSAPVNDCDAGGRMVFRYNTVVNSYFEMHDAIVTGARSCRKWEVYHNTFSMDHEFGAFVMLGIRGGTGVVFNNTYTTNGFSLVSPVGVALYRTGQTGGDPWDVLCSTSSGKATLASTTAPSGCTGTDNGCINLDGAGSGGYPCRDQFGFDGNDPQTTRPALFWNNTLDGVQTNGFSFIGPGTPSSYITENTDWCRSNTTSPPATCNGISTTYSPYTYPHPLQNVAGSAVPVGFPTGGLMPYFVEWAPLVFGILWHLRAVVVAGVVTALALGSSVAQAVEGRWTQAQVTTKQHVDRLAVAYVQWAKERKK